MNTTKAPRFAVGQRVRVLASYRKGQLGTIRETLPNDGSFQPRYGVWMPQPDGTNTTVDYLENESTGSY